MKLSDQTRSELIEGALLARGNAYAPYSKYAVGAALLTKSGEVFLGANIENAVYSETICAERSAVVAAASKGVREFAAIAVATQNGGSPCGACRQVMSEFGLDILVVMVNSKGEVVREATLSELLPMSFGPEDLTAS
jgi:cytidine deaminase